jgi:hypothetical protein
MRRLCIFHLICFNFLIFSKLNINCLPIIPSFLLSLSITLSLLLTNSYLGKMKKNRQILYGPNDLTLYAKLTLIDYL